MNLPAQALLALLAAITAITAEAKPLDSSHHLLPREDALLENRDTGCHPFALTGGISEGEPYIYHESCGPSGTTLTPST